MDLLRLITCGSVDDGKSTLIGRLLFDTHSIHQDQWDAVQRSSLKRGDQRMDLALLTDGLRAEREQGITIDVAYRYFSTLRRKFILADTPGHIQYTRNMVTGATTADLALILIDARQGVLEQTRRHAYIAALLGISHLVVCINKMDLVNWDQSTYERIRSDFAAFTTSGAAGGVFSNTQSNFIPMSALLGDNIASRSTNLVWHKGPHLLEHIESVLPRPLNEFPHARFPVQWVIRPQSAEFPDYRGYGGQLVSGELKVGDEIMALPTGQRSRIKRIHIGDKELARCTPPQSVTILLEDDVDISRGDTILHTPATHPNSAPTVSREFNATIVWMTDSPLTSSKRCIIKHGARYIRAILGPIQHRLNIHTLQPESTEQLALNEIGQVALRLASTIVYDPYKSCRATGAFAIIDEATNNTIGAGMIA